MVTVHMMIGIPASGKTTYAKELSRVKDLVVLSTDEVRNKHPELEEKDIWPQVYNECRELITNGKDFIFDATNITPKVRKRFKDEMEKQNNSFQIGAYYFDVPTSVCYDRVIVRNKDRNERFFPPEVIAEYGKNIIAPTEEEGFAFIKIIKSR